MAHVLTAGEGFVVTTGEDSRQVFRGPKGFKVVKAPPQAGFLRDLEKASRRISPLASESSATTSRAVDKFFDEDE